MKRKEYIVRKNGSGRTDEIHLLAIKLSINSSKRCNSCELDGLMLAVDYVSMVLFHHYPN